MRSLFSLRLEVKRKSLVQDVLIVFDAAASFAAEEFASLVESEIENNLVPDQLVLVVRDGTFAATEKALKEGDLFETTLNRLSGRSSVTLASYGVSGDEVRRTHIVGPANTLKVEFNDFRRRGISNIFNARQGFVESTSTYHFQNPSGRHTERFIRVSNILVRGAEIAFVAFCVLPVIPVDAHYVYLDTPALYAVVAAINEQRLAFGAQALLADNFSSYAGFENFVFDTSKGAVVLISASSSGSLAAKLIDEKGFEAKAIAHLLFLGEDKSRSKLVCDLRFNEKDNPEGVKTEPSVSLAKDCVECRLGSHAITLQGDQFEFAGPQQDALLIAKADAPEKLGSLLGRFAGAQVFEVGLGKAPGSRLFTVSATKLMESKAFQERLDYALRRSLPASTRYIIPADQDSLALSSRVKDACHSAAEVVDRADLEAKVGGVGSAIVIVCAVVESGRTLLDLSRDLRTIAPNAPLTYLVGFAKTTGEPRREKLGSSLAQTHNPYPYQVLEVEKMTLPMSSENNAWSDELTLLNRLSQTGADTPPSWLDDRRQRLRKISVGLGNELFLANAPGRKLKLQPGFVFWPEETATGAHSQADVFFTIASVLQQLRANAHRPGRSAIRSNWFQQTLLAPGNFGRFNDDIIQASILRAANPYELNYSDSIDDSRELGRLIRRIMEAASSERGGAAAEFLLALATKRLQLRQDDLRSVLSVGASSEPIVEYFRVQCVSMLTGD
jgi:hypothetical protein